MNLSCTALSKFPTIEKKHFFPYLTEKGKQINNVLKVANKTPIYIYFFNSMKCFNWYFKQPLETDYIIPYCFPHPVFKNPPND